MLRQPLIYFYSDNELKNPLYTIKFEGVTLVGTRSKPFEIWAKNISENELLNVEIHIVDANNITEKDVEIMPNKISFFPPDAIAKITLTFVPSAIRSEPLKGDIIVSCVLVKRA